MYVHGEQTSLSVKGKPLAKIVQEKRATMLMGGRVMGNYNYN